ncbi:CYTH domain-containing protein [Azospirillum fermentarium]|uniref:CYTH domain-containing protein n=1 Tax=Azospirillum fermentarium TaxID=1233114 RepID=UPI00222717CB|nr:CYTH domain-containing protein [Azospirillum fermentarium]MCW2244535.1 CYTH domain-containing protein [Azospirillum fermentarium]
MAVEIERRFLVDRDVSRLCRDGERIIQGYLPTTGQQTVRVRVAGAQGYLTIKGKRQGCCREEHEWEISPTLATEVIRHSCDGRVIEKIRYRVRHAGLIWEIDVFEGANAGLVIAEVELESPDQPVPLPDWVGLEVTSDHRFSNSTLSRTPCHPHHQPAAQAFCAA